MKIKNKKIKKSPGFTGFTGWRFNHLATSCTASSSNWMGTNNKEWMEGNQVLPTI